MNISLGQAYGFFGHGELTIDGDRHAAIFGASGSGKSTLLLNIAAAHIRAGHGLTVLDPHGDLVDRLLHLIPRRRTGDVLYFDPTAEKVVGLNPLAGADKRLRLEQALKIIATIWGENAWGPQSDYIARNAGYAILECEPDPTILHIYRFFVSKPYRAAILRKVKTPNLRSFLRTFDEEWDKRQQEQAKAPPLNKVDSFLSPVLRPIVGQLKGLDFGREMDASKIILCRLAKGALGPEAGAFIGSLIVSEILFAALARQGKKHRPPHAVIVDEFHNFTRGSSPEYLLSETRKYRVSLTIADQTLAQLPGDSEPAIFGNVSSIVSGRVSASDAERIGPELGLASGTTLTGLPNYEWYVSTVKDWKSDPIHMRGNPPPEPRGDEQSPRKLLARSASNYGAPREAVDERIDRFLEGGE